MGIPEPFRWRAAAACTLILIAAAIIRLDDLTSHAYMLDESWSVEISTGRGTVHHHLPTDQLLPPPPFYSLSEPWWKIWSNMEVTHPPLYSLLLRGWENLIGDTDYNGRLFSVIASLISIAILFEIVRLQAGLAPATWAALLMTVASPQVEHARLTRSYTLLTAVALLAIYNVIKIEKFGLTPRRWIGLAVAVLATLMTHYFCIGAIAGLLLYCAFFTSGPRRKLIAAIATAGITFAIIWLPWMWQQRHLFATDDPSTQFLTTDSSHHFRATIIRLLMDPIRSLLPHSESGIIGMLCMLLGAGLCLLPLIRSVQRQNSRTTLWALWLGGTLLTITLLDLSRGTDHLLYIRYTILAGPAVCALLPLLLARYRALMHLMSLTTVALCLVHLPDVYHHDDVDPRAIARDFLVPPGPQDVLVFAAPAADKDKCEIELFMLARYMQPMSCRVAILTRPADPQLLQQLATSRFIYLDCQGSDYQTWLPGTRLVRGRTFRNLGNVFTLETQQ